MSYPRDLVGYGANPPHPKWQGDAKIALQIVLNYEEGSEYSIPDGDDTSEIYLREVPGSSVGKGMRDLQVESVYEYGSRVGFWRLMRLFKAKDIPVTIFGAALALERNPAAVEAIVNADYDICCHGWRWIGYHLLDEAEEREHIQKAVASLKKLTGDRPLGWYCRYAPSLNTRRLIVEEGGFLYDSDAYNDDLPYWVEVKGSSNLVYLDESVFKEDVYRPYGWSKRGQKTYGDRQGKRGIRTSSRAGKRGKQLLAPVLFKGSTNALWFNQWLDEHLIPELKPNSTLILDNAAFHRQNDVFTIAEKAGHKVLFLPPYSPRHARRGKRSFGASGR